MHLKLCPTSKNAEGTGYLMGNNITITLQKSQEVHQRIVQKHLKVKQKIQDLEEKTERKIYISRKKAVNF